MANNIYHFSFGNSTDGPVGFCASISASSPEEAVDKLKGSLQDIGERNLVLDPREGLVSKNLSGVDYVESYFNIKAISKMDIDFWTDHDGNEHGPVVDSILDCPVIIVEGGLVQDVIHLVNPEKDYPDFLKFDLDGWENDWCPVCDNDSLTWEGGKKEKHYRYQTIGGKRRRVGSFEYLVGGYMVCHECGSKEGMTYTELVTQWLIKEKKDKENIQNVYPQFG